MSRPHRFTSVYPANYQPPTLMEKIQKHYNQLKAELKSGPGFWQDTAAFNALKQQKINGLYELSVVLNLYNTSNSRNPDSVSSAKLLHRLKAIEKQYPLLNEGTFSQCCEFFMTVKEKIQSAVLIEAEKGIEYTGVLPPMAHTTVSTAQLGL